MSTYPSVVATLTNPNATDRLNAPSHSSIESAQNSEVQQTQTFVGTLAATPGTLVYDIRSASSNGGGHVQTANVGGTGQTAYNKGDVLVASSSSVLTKLAVGIDAQVLTADSTQQTGIVWGNSPTGRVGVIDSVLTLSAGAASVYTVSVPGSVLFSSKPNTVVSTSYIPKWVQGGGASVFILAQYGGGNVASIMVKGGSTGDSWGIGKIVHTMIGSTLSSQKHILELDMGFQPPAGVGGGFPDVVTFNPALPTNPSLMSFVYTQARGVSSVDSGATQNVGLYMNVSDTNVSVSVAGIIVTKLT